MKKLLIPIALVAAIMIGVDVGVGVAVARGSNNASNPQTTQQTSQASNAQVPGRMVIKGGTYTPQCSIVNGVKVCKPINW